MGERSRPEGHPKRCRGLELAAAEPDTREYAAFCERVAGRFIHHSSTTSRPAPGAAITDPAAAIGATVAAMRAAGLPVDAELWVPGSKCSQYRR